MSAPEGIGEAGPAGPMQGRRRLLLYLVPLGVIAAARAVGVASAPALVSGRPLLLILLAPFFRHLVLVSSSLDAPTFVVAAVASMLAADPFCFLIGRAYGDDAVQWVARRSGRAGRLVRATRRVFRSAGPLLVFVAPGPLVCLLAGASRMRAGAWLAINLAGTLTAVVLVRVAGRVFANTVEAILGFVETNVLLLTVVSMVLVLIGAAVRGRRLAAGEPVTADADRRRGRRPR